MKATLFLIIGLVLMALAGLWFLSPVPDLVVNSPALERELSTRGVGGDAGSVVKWAEIVFDALNAFFGGIGFYMTVKGWRLKRADKAGGEEQA